MVSIEKERITNKTRLRGYFARVAVGLVASFAVAGCMSNGATESPNQLRSSGKTKTVSGWKLVWDDEFNEAKIDPTKWTFDLGGSGWGNQELEYYTNLSENARIEDGHLVIEARKQLFGNREYTSARLKTEGLYAFKYGRVEARIQIPRGQGIWPAFWLLGNNFTTVGWPQCGEIDIMENIGRQPDTVHGSAHGPGYSGADSLTGPYVEPNAVPFADGYHTYGVEWEPNSINWFVDGNVYFHISPKDLPENGKWVFDHPFFIILNVAVGGDWPGAPDETSTFPQKMNVDYVRVYARD